jgi:hypothetical protein
MGFAKPSCPQHTVSTASPPYDGPTVASSFNSFCNCTGTVTITTTVSDSTGWPFKEEKKPEKMKVNPKEREKSKYVSKYGNPKKSYNRF